MKTDIDLTEMRQWPPFNNASWYFHAEVVAAGERYLLYLMFESWALVGLEQEFPTANLTDIVMSFYQAEVRKLLDNGQLRPAGARRAVNTVFFTHAQYASHVKDVDIVICDAIERLRRVGELRN